MSKSNTERRVHKRHPLAIEGRVSADGAVARMTASNVSLGGVYCTSTEDFPEMTRLAVRMNLPDDGRAPRALDLEAVVVRREPCSSPTGGDPRYHLALYFTRIDDEQKSILANFLSGNA